MNLAHYLKNPMQIVPRIRYYFWEKLNPEKPWLCKEAVGYCDSNLDINMKGIEFGSGRSTIWFAGKLGSLVSIEHDASWYSKVAGKISEKKLYNIDYKLIPLNHPESEGEKSYQVLPDYVGVFLNYPDNYFDFVVVDGHYRTNVIFAAVPKIKSGGLILVDDVNFWGDYDNVPVPKEWQLVSISTNGIKKTGIWRVP
jgi:hypothetical protein